MAISTAVDLTRVSRAVGYKLKKANFSPSTPYLPQRIDIIGEANTANQATLDTDPFDAISADEVGAKYGYGSPLHQVARILRPVSGSLIGGIPTVFHAQTSDVAATACVIIKGVAVAGSSATASATHYIIINGRYSVDGGRYAYTVSVGDNAAAIIAKIIDAVNNVIGTPVIAAISTTNVSFTTKWEGATAAELNIEFDTDGNDAGVTYSEVSKTGGAGTVTLTTALAQLSAWTTILVNTYGTAALEDLEDFNGVPDPDIPTGRYTATDWKPLVALFGSLLDTKAGIIAITDAAARKDQVTNVLCPAPGSTGFSWEAAANVAAIVAPIMQNTPHASLAGRTYNDMPVPSDEDINEFATFDNRDYLVKHGSSTVKLNNGKYEIQDLVTTYHPAGEDPPKFRFVRDLMVNFNNGFSWILIMQEYIQDKTIVPDDAPVNVTGTISPKQVRQLISSFATQQAKRALIADIAFTEDSAEVGINEDNPARLDIFFRTKITSVAHIVSTDVEFDFNYTA